MEEIVIVDVVETCKNLEKYALDARAIQAPVVSCFHELVEIAIHMLHTDVKLL